MTQIAQLGVSPATLYQYAFVARTTNTRGCSVVKRSNADLAAARTGAENWIVLGCGCMRACPIVVFGEGAPEQIFATRMPNDGRSFMRGENGLVQASRGGDFEEVQALLSQGCDVNSRSKDGGTALVSASWTGHLDIVRALLSKGAAINLKSLDAGLAGGHTPLIAASRQGHLKVVEALLAAGADVHAKDGEGRDALMCASAGDYRRIVRTLLSNGTSPKATDRQGNTALILARSADVARLLLEAGAEVNARCHSGKTALMYASYGDIGIVRVLLAAGADPDLRNNDGETALDMAMNEDIRNFLQHAPVERGIRRFFRR